ncbi:MAG: hypothetical protein ACERLB_17195, partial [Gammaproteobacteria bacterium]
KVGPMSAASALGLTCVPRLELNGPALRHFDSQLDSLRINQRFPKKFIACAKPRYRGSAGKNRIHWHFARMESDFLLIAG